VDVGVDAGVAEGLALNAGVPARAQAENRRTIRRKIDLRCLAIAPSMRKLIPEFHIDIK
jgi:hypothetical protein